MKGGSKKECQSMNKQYPATLKGASKMQKSEKYNRNSTLTMGDITRKVQSNTTKK